MTIYHTHHIVPRHMGGDDSPENLIELTVDQHAEEHWVLYCMYGNAEDYLAWRMLSGQIVSGEEYMRECSAMGGRKSSNKGYIPTEEHKRKISKSKFGKKRPEISGDKHPYYKSKEKSNFMTNLNDKITKCPKCGKLGKNYGNMKRWHFDNCRGF